jgi:uncharacterized protein YraI
MNARRLARWALRAALIGALAAGVVYTAHAASADEPQNLRPGPSTSELKDGASWG